KGVSLTMVPSSLSARVSGTSAGAISSATIPRLIRRRLTSSRGLTHQFIKLLTATAETAGLDTGSLHDLGKRGGLETKLTVEDVIPIAVPGLEVGHDFVKLGMTGA